MDSPEARKLVKEEFIDLRNKDLTRRITNILHGYYLDLRKYVRYAEMMSPTNEAELKILFHLT